MPPPRKIDTLPEELRDWLKSELVARGFGQYEDLAEALNFRLEEAGMELRIGKSAIHEYGQEYREFAKANEMASAWATEWMRENGMADEAKRHNVLFQMITALAFKVMQAQMLKDGDEISPQELHFLGRMLKDVMASSGIREKLMADERDRARAEQKAEQIAKLDAAVQTGDTRAEIALEAKRILGFSA